MGQDVCVNLGLSKCGWAEWCMFFFFKQKTAYEIKECDWSSDVCSSDLHPTYDTRTRNSPAGRRLNSISRRPREKTRLPQRDRKSVV